MNTDWTSGGKRKRHRKEQQTKTYYNRKLNSHAVDRGHEHNLEPNSHAVDRVYEHNLEPNTHMSSEDILALKIHGLYNGNDSSSSDSGLSTFDEDYYKYKPQPIQIDINRIIVIRSRKDTNAKHKTYRDATLSRQKLGRKNYKSSNGNTPKTPVSSSEVDKDEVERGVTKQSNLTNEKGSIYTISDGRDKTIPHILEKNLVDQRRPRNEIKPRTLVVDTSQVPNDIRPIPKPTGVFSNQDLNYRRLPLPQGKVVMPEVAKTHSLSSIPSIESRQPKNDAQSHKSFANDFEQAYNHLQNVIEDLDTAASKYPHIKSGQGKKLFAETLKNHPGTQGSNKTVISSRQIAPKVHPQLKPDLAKPFYVNPVQDCSQLPPNKIRQPSVSKNEASLDKSVATFGQTRLENSDKKSTSGQNISNDILKKPAVTQKISQFEERVQVSKNYAWVDQSHNRHAAKSNENIPPIRRGSPHNLTERNTFRGSTRIPQRNNILRHIPDQTDVIVRQPQVLPIQQTTQRSQSTLGENAEHEDETNLLGEASEGYFARLRIFCCCSRT